MGNSRRQCLVRGARAGHGGLNILPHKSWNVYGFKQRQKVARDEAEAEARREPRATQTHNAGGARGGRADSDATSASSVAARPGPISSITA